MSWDDAALAARLYPTMAKGNAPAPFRAAEPQAAPAPVAAPSSYDDMASRMGYKDQPVVSNEFATLAPGSFEERASRMPYEQNQAPDLGDDDQSVDAPVLAPVPDAVQELRDQDNKRGMYQNAFTEVLPDQMLGDSDLPEPTQKAMVAELREMATDVAASPADVDLIRTIGNELQAPPSQAKLTEWSDQTADLLNSTFGGTASMALADARKLVARDPRLGRILENNGLGSHPKVVLTLARLARQARLDGKL
ncbi:hypothetical protein [Limnohabitans sp. Bal53]|uniref:hypothetical protein n=1 Tax=Limnohabitans sp. Bal53 TaxID=1977910 RepID=UPI000D3BB23C|nr:hypothetical protein [Limnohabitans sp. Bal53]PUE41426.1 hypothetical protein B9Z50_06880 [Limnohabitans sp. Bal53]